MLRIIIGTQSRWPYGVATKQAWVTQYTCLTRPELCEILPPGLHKCDRQHDWGNRTPAMPRVGPDLLFWVGRGDQRLVDIVPDLIQQPDFPVSPTIARSTTLEGPHLYGTSRFPGCHSVPKPAQAKVLLEYGTVIAFLCRSPLQQAVVDEEAVDHSWMGGFKAGERGE